MKNIFLVTFICAFTVISAQSEQNSLNTLNCEDGQGNCKRVSQRRKKLIQKSTKEANYITLPPDDPERIKIDNLVDWLKKGNVEFPKMDIVFFHKNFRGVISNRKIFVGSTVLFVPITHLITYESSLAESSMARRWLEMNTNVNNARHSVVALHLLEQMENPNSFWKPYLDIFPADYNDFPLNFGTLEMSMLQNSSFKDEIIQQKKEYLQDYDSIIRKLPEMELFSYEEFAYARIAVQSRIFGVQIDGQQTQVMVPFADMLNHAKQHTTTWTFNQQRYGFVITAESDIESGLEVFDTYGQKSSKIFYLHYGFLEDGNTQQSATIYVCLSARDRLHNLKQLIFKKMVINILNIVKPCISFSVTRQNQLKDPLSLSRILAIDSIDDYLTIEKKIGKSQYTKIGPVSISNEIKALQMLKQLALNQIEEFGTSIEEDDILLKKETSWSYMNIIKYRKQEKELLREIANNMEDLVLLYTQPQQLNTNTNPEIKEYIKDTYDILTQQQL